MPQSGICSFRRVIIIRSLLFEGVVKVDVDSKRPSRI